MDAFRRAKSSSPTSRVDISEVSSWADYSGKTTPTLLQELINEPPSSPSETAKSAKSFCVAADDESAESSDNISQYLDKEDREPIPRMMITPKGSTKSAPEFTSSSSKRKPSIESKYNQAKEGMVKKLQKAKKSMIKVPKLSFPTKKMRKPSISTPPKEEKPKNQSEKSKRAELLANPVYIHIPLKPPPGETDEFSHFEFELKNTNGDLNKKTTPEESSNTPSPSSSIRKKQPLKINPMYKQLLKDVCELGNKEKAEAQLEENPPQTTSSLILDEETVKKSEIKVPSSQSSPEDETRIEEDFDKLFEASSSKLPIIESENSRNIRSKSAEPQTNKQRRSSLESSYSRKSLSKLAIMKKLKVATEKIKNAFSMDTMLRRKGSSSIKISVAKSPSKTEDESASSVKKKPKTDLAKPKKTIEPVYIHIPLKPPEGEKDEFSYLNEETLSDDPTQSPPRKEERNDSLESASPTNNGDIQFIFLTPPSDDEILDKDEPDLPETPSSDEMLPLSTLKKLAEDAVDQISPSATKITPLETVREESISEKSSINNDVSLKLDLEPSERENVVVDVEDGLNETKTEEEVLKSALKTTAESSTAAKRVSFKRKSKSGDIKEESGYEIIEVPKDEADAAILKEAAASNSIKNEEKTVDSLAEDYNKWSNITGDHEYEPINAPTSPNDEEVLNVVAAPRSSPITVLLQEDDADPKIVISATDILEQPYDDEENKQKRSFFQIGRFRKRSNSSISETQSKSSQNAEISAPAAVELEERRPSSTQKLQDAIKLQTGKLKAKFQNIHLPKAPEFKRPQLFTKLPKIPDRTIIHLPNISIPGAQKRTETHTIETRQYSTESNVDESELKTKRFFDFKKFSGTFPRFKKKTKKPSSSLSSASQQRNIEAEQMFATIPRITTNNNNAEVEISPEESFRFNAEKSTPSNEVLNYEREVQAINEAEYLKRWQHGNFRDGTTEEEQIVGALVQQRFGKSSGQGSEQSNSETLEERLQRDEARIPSDGYFEAYDDNDEFNISSKYPMITDLDNLEDEQQTPGGYSSEGSLNNLPQRGGRLGKLDVNSDEFFVVQEISEGFQTPANALAQMNAYDPIGSNRSLPTQSNVKPERKSIKNKPKRHRTPHVSQEEMIHDDEESIEELIIPDRPKRRSKRNKNKPLELIVVPSESHQRLDFPRESLGILGDDEAEIETLLIAAPPRKHRSLKSLTQSEENNESILLEPVEAPSSHSYYSPEPSRPNRRSRSTSRISSTPSHTRDNFDGFFEHTAENAETTVPCVEEPCIQDIRDYMGYAIVDKNKPAREPPLPPPRTPPRRKKREISEESQKQGKFATVPRNHRHQEPSAPIRPLRNYSTLSHMKISRKDNSLYENQNNNKENNASTSQYTEIDNDEIARDLISGDVVQKMRQRPLPAPPRPPRTKPRHHRKSLQDITSEIQNIQQQEEITVSTQTEPLPSNFVCEEIIISQEPTDIVITPTRISSPIVERFELFDPREREIRRELLTPTQYSFEETVTHGTLLVKPLNEAEILPEHQLSREHLIPINREYETTEIPESFHRLKSPEEAAPKVVQIDKLHVSDLDVDKLTVNELVASKVIVSEIDTSSITTNEIITTARKDGSNITTLKFDTIQKKTPTTEDVELENPQNYSDINDPPPLPPPRAPSEENNSSSSSIRLQKLQELDIDDDDVQTSPPPRPPQPLYLPFQPPASFYALRAKKMVNDDENIIPTPPSRRRRNNNHRSRPNRSSSTTDNEDNNNLALHHHSYNRNFRRFSEPSTSNNNIAELSGQLMNACGHRINNSLKRLIYYLTENVLRNYDGNQDLHVFMIIILVLIAGLILLGYGEDGRTVVHLHHWEFFNPPKDL